MEIVKALSSLTSGMFTNKLNPSVPIGSQVISSSGSEVRFRIFDTFLSELFGGSRSLNSFMKAFRKSPLVFIVVNKIASTSAAIKRVYENASGDLIDNSKIEELLNNPNLKQSRIELYESANQGLLLAGNTFFFITKSVGVVGAAELDVLKPNKMKIFIGKDGEVSKYHYTQPNGRILNITDPNLVLHIKESNLTQSEVSNEEWGISKLEAMWIVVKSSDEKFQAEASIFKNRGYSGMLTNDSDMPMLPEEAERLQEEFDEDMGGAHKFNKMKLSNTKLRHIQFSMSPTELKLLDGIISSLRLICAAYSLPSIVVNDIEKTAFNNISEAKKSAFVDAYLPLADKIDQKLSPWLSMHLGVQETIKADRTSIEELRNTANDVMNAINSLEPTVAKKVVEALSINDALELVGLDPIGPEGDVRLGPGTKDTDDAGKD